MKINLSIEKKHILTLVIVICIISSIGYLVATPATPGVSHPADEVAPGPFAAGGTYTFPEDLQVDGNIYLGAASNWLIDTGTNLIREDILPYCEEEITSDVYINGQSQATGCSFGGYDGYYDISSLTPDNVRSGVAYGRGEIGTMVEGSELVPFQDAPDIDAGPWIECASFTETAAEPDIDMTWDDECDNHLDAQGWKWEMCCIRVGESGPCGVSYEITHNTDPLPDGFFTTGGSRQQVPSGSHWRDVDLPDYPSAGHPIVAGWYVSMVSNTVSAGGRLRVTNIGTRPFIAIYPDGAPDCSGNYHIQRVCTSCADDWTCCKEGSTATIYYME